MSRCARAVKSSCARFAATVQPCGNGTRGTRRFLRGVFSFYALHPLRPGSGEDGQGKGSGQPPASHVPQTGLRPSSHIQAKC